MGDLDPGTLGELGPDKAFKLCPPVGSFPGLLGRKLARLVLPQLYRGLVPVDTADHRSVRTAGAQSTVLQPISVEHILSGHKNFF